MGIPDFSRSNIVVIAIILVAIAILRYLLVAGGSYLVCYKKLLEKLRSFKIQPALPAEKQIRNELNYSLFSILVFSLMGVLVLVLYRGGHTRIYTQVNERGIFYFLVSFILLLVFHDTYFYWTHRFLHTRWLLKHIHYVHHRSTNPTPLAAYSFHPVEALIESGFVIPVVLFFPVQMHLLFFFTFFVFLLNVVGHLGFEFLPKTWRNKGIGRQFTSSTHHNLHHQKCNKNFSYYFTFWDKVMKTLSN